MGKEYDPLVYEGEFVNGKKSGKGKEYLNGRLIFEGEFLNGQRNGKGKSYSYKNGIKVLELEYLNGQIWNGIEYDSKGNIFYEIKNGKLRKKYDRENINDE